MKENDDDVAFPIFDLGGENWSEYGERMAPVRRCEYFALPPKRRAMLLEVAEEILGPDWEKRWSVEGENK